MTAVVLTEAQAAEVGRGRFVRVGPVPEQVAPATIVGPGTVVVGKVDGTWRAYANVCRHRALPLDLGARSPMSDDGRYLLCHQHGAIYRLRDGLCVSGPCAGESLTGVTVSEKDGTLLVGE